MQKNITKILGVGVMLSILLTPVLFLKAEGIGASVKADTKVRFEDQIERKENKLERIEGRDDRMSSSSEKREDSIKNQIERKENLMLKFRERLEVREFRITNLLENIAKRLGERITILEARGIVLTEAKASLAQANLKITEAKVESEKLKVLIQAEVNATTTPGEIREDIKAAQEKVKDLVKEAHRSLNETVREIKVSVKVTATSTNN